MIRPAPPGPARLASTARSGPAPRRSRSARVAATGSLAAVVLVVSLLAGCAHGQGSRDAFCSQLRSLSNRSVLLGRFDPFNPSDLAVYKRSAATDMSKLERAAPRDIKPDVAAVADLTAEIAQLTEKYQNDPAELRYRLYDLGRHRVGAASSVVKVVDYAKSKCGIDINAERRRRAQRSGSDSGSFDSGSFDSGSFDSGPFDSGGFGPGRRDTSGSDTSSSGIGSSSSGS